MVSADVATIAIVTPATMKMHQNRSLQENSRPRRGFADRCPEFAVHQITRTSKSFDLRFLYPIWIAQSPSDDIVIVAIDENSILRLGRWPWSRRYHADLIDKLGEAGPKVIGLSIIFSEPDLAHLEDDYRLGQAIKNSGTVVLPVINNPVQLKPSASETVPIPHLLDAAASLGHVNIELDGDGIARSVFLDVISGEIRWSSFGLAMKQVTDGEHLKISAQFQNSNQQSAQPWVKKNRMLIPYVEQQVASSMSLLLMYWRAMLMLIN